MGSGGLWESKYGPPRRMDAHCATAAALDLRRRWLVTAPLGCALPANAAERMMRRSSDIGSYADATWSQRAPPFLGAGFDLGQEPSALTRASSSRRLRIRPRASSPRTCPRRTACSAKVAFAAPG